MMIVQKLNLEMNNHTGSKIKEIKEYTLIESYISFLNTLSSYE